MTRRQVELKSGDTYMVVWLPEDPRLRAGTVLTLKEIPDVKWTVNFIFSPRIDDESYFHRRWNFDYYEKLPGLDIKPA